MRSIDKVGGGLTPQPAEKVANPVFLSLGQQGEDEIDLFELVEGIWQQKWWLFGSVVVCFLLATAYLLWVPSSYKLEVVLQPPTSQDLAALAVPLGVPAGVSSDDSADDLPAEAKQVPAAFDLQPQDALAYVVRELSSYHTRVSYWASAGDLFGDHLQPSAGMTQQQQLARFDSNNFSLKLPGDKSEGSLMKVRTVGFSLRYSQGMDGVGLASGLLEAALSEAKAAVVADWNAARTSRLRSLQRQLLAKRTVYDSYVASRSAKLSEALEVARRLDISKPAAAGLLAAQTSTERGAESGAADVPLYLMGSIALQAELDALNARPKMTNSEVADVFADQPQDIYIDGLASLKSQARYLQQLQPDFSSLKLAELAREPSQPYDAVKPKSRLVLALALVLGLVLGVMLALLRSAWFKHQFSKAGD